MVLQKLACRAFDSASSTVHHWETFCLRPRVPQRKANLWAGLLLFEVGIGNWRECCERLNLCLNWGSSHGRWTSDQRPSTLITKLNPSYLIAGLWQQRGSSEWWYTAANYYHIQIFWDTFLNETWKWWTVSETLLKWSFDILSATQYVHSSDHFLCVTELIFSRIECSDRDCMFTWLQLGFLFQELTEITRMDIIPPAVIG